MQQTEETVHPPTSAADAGNFVPSWAGAVAIDVLPGVLVYIEATAQAAIRSGRETTPIAEQLTLAELRAAMAGIGEIERQMDDRPHTEQPAPPAVPTQADHGPRPQPRVSAIDPARRGE